MNRREQYMSLLGAVAAGTLIVAGIAVVGFFILMGIALLNFGNNK